MKRIVVLGAGESGVGSAILAQKKGFDVFVSDMSAIKDKYKKELEQYGIAYEEKQHTEALILNADEVIKSPGIPETAPLIVKLRAQGTHIISEIEFAGRYTGDSVKVCITGSNGKTTTTTLIHHIFTEAGLDASLAGNVGFSLARQVAIDPHKYYIIELSSFQLDGMYDFKADFAILMNITPDHLDRYDHKFQNYIDSKLRIVQNMTPNDYFIYWDGDPIVAKEIEKRDIKAKMCPFNIDKKEGLAAFIENENYTININNKQMSMEKEKISIKGLHNTYNAMAAGITAFASGITSDKVREALSDFQGVEHRLEQVARVRNVLFINDSKATNVNSCWYALQCMKTPVVLILGGKDKGNDYNEIKSLVEEKVRALVFLGVDNSKLHEFFDGMGKPTADVQSMKDAVEKSFEMAEKGDTVLLSPCCASFDLFMSYEDRGQQFKEQVKNL
ncbi:MAG: UDP-N-acetylmuramoyl-L-alanine--D-glutamate ligase [Paludibacteraceae bacterium]|nr:UDP-N-acetylmuramoyl-L-alanine--D-glutamate ligase [Paludibacteraceae bacterium]